MIGCFEAYAAGKMDSTLRKQRSNCSDECKEAANFVVRHRGHYLSPRSLHPDSWGNDEQRATALQAEQTMKACCRTERDDSTRVDDWLADERTDPYQRAGHLRRNAAAARSKTDQGYREAVDNLRRGALETTLFSVSESRDGILRDARAVPSASLA